MRRPQALWSYAIFAFADSLKSQTRRKKNYEQKWLFLERDLSNTKRYADLIMLSLFLGANTHSVKEIFFFLNFGSDFTCKSLRTTQISWYSNQIDARILDKFHQDFWMAFFAKVFRTMIIDQNNANKSHAIYFTAKLLGYLNERIKIMKKTLAFVKCFSHFPADNHFCFQIVRLLCHLCDVINEIILNFLWTSIWSI